MVPLPLCVKRPIKSQCQRLPSGARAPLARSLESLEFEPDLEKVLRAQEQRHLQPNYVPGVTKFLPITAESALLKAQGHVRASDLPGPQTQLPSSPPCQTLAGWHCDLESGGLSGS